MADELLTLYIGNIWFKDIIYLQDHNITARGGNLGFKLILHDGEKFLVGRRSREREYLQGMHSLLGGMIEEENKEDLKGAIQKELTEEYLEPLKIDLMYLVAIMRESIYFGYNLIFYAKVSRNTSLDIISANDEWENQELHWMTIQSIQKLVDRHHDLEYLLYWMEKQ
ncbi:MAG: NUDIX domain-containing protein [Candidatus Heimdallarchaeota archaeon]|nr:NUDIX domain-containing protein [Candidatus Heimdallarchaeota archaeon]